MTGPRSTGCELCRKRKIKCDEIKPACTQCTVSRRDCPGYNKRVIFEKDHVRRQSNIPKKPRHRLTGHCTSIDHKVSKSSANLTFLSTCALGSQLMTPQQRTENCIQFLLKKLHPGRKPELDADWYYSRALDHPVSSLAIKALAILYFGRFFCHGKIVRNAEYHYTKAVEELRKSLDHNQPNDEATLLSAAILVTYEMHRGNNTDRWIIHAFGLGQLIETYGPRMCSSRVGRAIFLDQRLVIIAAAISRRKRSFLAKQEWKSPNLRQNENDPFEMLLDIAADVSGHLEDETVSCLFSENQMRAFVARLRRSFDQLNDWWRDWQMKISDKCWEDLPDRTVPILWDRDGAVFEKSIKFTDFHTAYTSITYDAVRITLLDVWYDTSRNLNTKESHPLHEERNPTPLLGITSNRMMLAMEILRSAENYQPTVLKTLGPAGLIFPLTHATIAAPPGSRQAAWLQHLSALIKGRVPTADYRRLEANLEECMILDARKVSYEVYQNSRRFGRADLPRIQDQSSTEDHTRKYATVTEINPENRINPERCIERGETNFV